MRRTGLGLLLACGVLAVGPAAAATVSWTNWTSAGTGNVTGSLSFGQTTLGVSYTGSYGAAQVNGGTNYWVPSTPYTSAAVSNAPPDSDIIQLTAAGTHTVAFAQAVLNPVLALVSWNGNSVTFNASPEVLSDGCGYWGCGTFSANGANVTTGGEAHGAIRLSGTFTSISFTTAVSEGWHGFTIGAEGLAPPPPPSVPEPGTLALLGAGLLGLIGARRRHA